MSPSNALPYDVCVALRDAGFPQRIVGDTTMHYYCETSSADRRNEGVPDAEREPVWELMHGTQGWVHNVACPGTDELITALSEISTRWLIQVGNRTRGTVPGWYAWAGYTRATGEPQVAYGNTPASALAALYLALAKEQSSGQ